MTFDKKEWQKNYQKKYRSRLGTKEKIREYRQKPKAIEVKQNWYKRPEVQERIKTWRNKHNQKPETIIKRKEYTKRPEVAKKAYARCLAARAKIPVLECIRCGSKELLQRHHRDYDKPLEVVILCHQCHVDEHKTLKTLAPSTI